MLILTRKVHGVIVIGGDVRVTVLAIKGGQVSLGIDAPRSIPVDREEIFVRKLKETQGESVSRHISRKSAVGQA